MDATELEETLSELEQRVERLRALYEQYFMGIEKIEPAVLRKDVDRRFWILRRAQIRNTAMRFKLNTINQRYNTYQQYWQRNIREIEAGTYKRHVLRAEKRFGNEALTITAKKRFGRNKDVSPEEQQAIEERAKKALEQVADLDEFDVDFGSDELFRPMEPATEKELRPAAQPAARPNAPPVRAAHSLDDLDDLESLMGLDAGPTVWGSPGPRAAQPSQPARPLPPRPQVPVRRSQPQPAKAAKTEGDHGFGNIGGVFAEHEDDQTAPHARIPPVVPPPHPPRPGAPGPARPSAPGPTRPSAPGTPLPRPVPPPGRPPVPTPAQPSPLSRPSQPRPATPATPAKPPPVISDDRVKELYREYVTAKRQCNESTSSITEASLAKSLRGTAEKLKEKHRGRRIDYEVVIKDGRAVLKPIVKS